MFNTSNTPHTNDKGFTLVETIATISIMSVLATISLTTILPVWQNANTKLEELKTQTETLNTLQQNLDTLNLQGTTN